MTYNFIALLSWDMNIIVKTVAEWKVLIKQFSVIYITFQQKMFLIKYKPEWRSVWDA